MTKPVFNLDPNKHMTVLEHRIGGVYAKECRLPVGYHFPQHRHKFEHMSVLVSGIALVEVDGVTLKYEGPAVIRIEARKVHTVTPVTPCVWICIHAVDPETQDVEAELVANG